MTGKGAGERGSGGAEVGSGHPAAGIATIRESPPTPAPPLLRSPVPRLSPNRFALALGGNLGDVPATAERAAILLAPLVRVVARSAWHRTAPVGPAQPDFWNAAWIVATDLGPHQLLDRLLAVETACGRARGVRWGPRTLDLDLILAADGRTVATPVLTLPHPRWTERAFVLAPLAEIAADWRDPAGVTVAARAAALGLPGPAPGAACPRSRQA